METWFGDKRGTFLERDHVVHPKLSATIRFQLMKILKVNEDNMRYQ